MRSHYEAVGETSPEEGGRRRPACRGFIIPRRWVYLSVNADHREPRLLDHTGPVPHPHLRCLPSWCPLRPPASRGGFCQLEPSPGNRPGTAGGLGHLLPQRSFREGILGDAQAHPRSRGKRVPGSSGDSQPSGIEGAKDESKCWGGKDALGGR